jgi:hypothetical protein
LIISLISYNDIFLNYLEVAYFFNLLDVCKIILCFAASEEGQRSAAAIHAAGLPHLQAIRAEIQ